MTLPVAYPGTSGPIAFSSVTVTGSSAPTNGIYLPAANTVGIATNGVLRVSVSTTALSSGLNTIIGSTSVAPDGTLHVHTASAGAVTPDASANDLVVENSGDTGISILSPDGNYSQVIFGSPSEAIGSYVYWQYNINQFVVASAKVGASLVLAGGDAIANLTLSGAAGSELTAAAGSVSVAKFLRTASAGTLTIASGVVTATGSFHLVDTEGAGAADDLDTINGGAAGDILVISAANDARTVVAKDGTGNLLLNGDFSMDNTNDTLTLQYRGGNWCELSRSDNTA